MLSRCVRHCHSSKSSQQFCAFDGACAFDLCLCFDPSSVLVWCVPYSLVFSPSRSSVFFRFCIRCILCQERGGGCIACSFCSKVSVLFDDTNENTSRRRMRTGEVCMCRDCWSVREWRRPVGGDGDPDLKNRCHVGRTEHVSFSRHCWAGRSPLSDHQTMFVHRSKTSAGRSNFKQK